MDLFETWTIGEVIKKIRIEQGISLQQLGCGLCSAATLSRIEAGERDMDMIMAAAIFERLGYNPDIFEIYTDKEQFYQYNQRLAIRRWKDSQMFPQMKSALAEYQKQMRGNTDRLQRQFIKSMNGILELREGRREEGVQHLEEAIALTVPHWDGKWHERMVLGYGELELFDLLADAYETMEKSREAHEMRRRILQYLEQKQSRKDQMVKLYTGIICRMIPYLLEQNNHEEALHLCRQGLKTLSDTCSLNDLPELTYWRAKCEGAFYRQGNIQKNQVIGSYQRSYYFYRMLKRDREAEKIKEYLLENYQWQCTR